MIACIVVPVLVLPLLFVLQELERWALGVPTGSHRERGRQHEDDVVPRAARVRHPRSAG